MTSDSTTTKPRGKVAPASRARPVSKKDQLIRMLGSAAGADIATISTKLGWQAHTVRAALTGLRKAGHAVTAEKPGEGRPARYRIHAAPAAPAPAAPNPAAPTAATPVAKAATEPRDVPHAG